MGHACNDQLQQETSDTLYFGQVQQQNAPHKSANRKPEIPGMTRPRSVIIKGTSIFDSQAGGYKALMRLRWNSSFMDWFYR